MLLKKHGVTDSEAILLRLIENQLDLLDKAGKRPNVTYDNVANLTSNESLNQAVNKTANFEKLTKVKIQ